MMRAPWGILLAATVTACGGIATGPAGGDAGGDASGGGASSGGSGSGGSSSGGSSASGSSGGGSSGASGGGSSSGAANEGGQGGACTADAQCGTGMICGFPTADACAAKGSCFPAPGVTCDAFSPGCACDGTELNLACNGLPTGYAPGPLLHTGVCATLDAGAVCTSDAQCAVGLKCCYPCGIPGCSNECVTPLGSGMCPAYP